MTYANHAEKVPVNPPVEQRIELWGFVLIAASLSIWALSYAGQSFGSLFSNKSEVVAALDGGKV